MSVSTSSTAQEQTHEAAPDAATEVWHALESSSDAPRLLLFTAAGQTCACELSAVREIIPFRRATRLPGAPRFVVGLVNLRGSLVTVLDLGLRLGGRGVDVEKGSIILAECGTRVVGLGVDDLRDVQRVARASIEPAGPDATHDGAICGVLRTETDIAVLLDVAQIVTHAFA